MRELREYLQLFSKRGRSKEPVFYDKQIKSLQIVILFILCSVAVLVVAKIAFIHTEILPLHIYGVGVTGITLITFFLAFLVYIDPYAPASKLPIQYRKRLRVACLVAVHNEENLIGACVESLIAQKYGSKEIIIIDDASTDNSVAVLEPYAKEGKIRLIRLRHNVGKKRALALGMSLTDAQIFVFSDSDSVVAPDVLQKSVAIFNYDPLIGAISGHVRALNAEASLLARIQDTWYEGQFSIRKAAESCFGAVTCVSGPLAMFRREAIYNYIPAWKNDTFLGEEFRFATDRTLTGYVLGSTTVGVSLQKKYAYSQFVTKQKYAPREWKVVYSHSCRAWTKVPEKFDQLMSQQIRWKKSFIRNIFFTGAFFWKKNPVVVSLYYSHAIFVIVGPLIAFRHLVYLPWQGSLVSAALYLVGVLYMGCMFGLAFRAFDGRPLRWLYRPLMSVMSTFVFSWLIFYSAMTIKKMIWIRNR